MIDPQRIRVLGPRLLVKREPTPDTTRGGLWLLGRDLPAIGQVLKVGTEIRPYTNSVGSTHYLRHRVSTEVDEGDLITYDKYHWGDLWTYGENLEWFIIDLKWVFARLRRDFDGRLRVKPLQGWVVVKKCSTLYSNE